LLYVEMTFFRSIFCDNLPQKYHCTLTADQGLKKNCDIHLFSKFSIFLGKNSGNYTKIIRLFIQNTFPNICSPKTDKGPLQKSWRRCPSGDISGTIS
jgi:hypothetical protein